MPSRSPQEVANQGRVRHGLILMVLLAGAIAAIAYLVDVQRQPPPLTNVRSFSLPATIPVPSFPTGKLRPIPAWAKVIVVGDSWADGYAAEPGHGYVDDLRALMKWKVARLGIGTSTGYVTRGAVVKQTYLQRLQRWPRDPSVRLVIMQGGVNDAHAAIAGRDLNTGMKETLAQARRTFPSAQVLVLGPLSPSPTGSPVISGIDNRLAYEADAAGDPYLSPIREGWFPSAAAVAKYIDPKTLHPKNLGHAYFAERIAEDVRKLESGNLP